MNSSRNNVYNESILHFEIKNVYTIYIHEYKHTEIMIYI